MKLALVGYGGVGRAFVELLALKDKYLKKNGLSIRLNYVLTSKGGIYDPKGIDLVNLMEFSKNEKDITKYPNGGDINNTFSYILENKDIDLLVEMTPTNMETIKHKLFISFPTYVSYPEVLGGGWKLSPCSYY